MASDLHVELLCGGTPSFLVARALKVRLESYDTSVSLIRIDTAKELRGMAHSDNEHPISFVWTQTLKQRLRERLNDPPDSFPILGRVRKDQLEKVLDTFEETDPPFDNVVGVQLAFELTWPSLTRQMEDDLEQASQKSRVWVCPCVVFEGPTGTGVAWELLERLPSWMENYRNVQFTHRRFLQRQFFQHALFEFIPELPLIGSSDEENVLQGAVSRVRAHRKQPLWDGMWFRFDGAKVKTGENALADAVGAAAMALLITAEVQRESSSPG